MSKRQDTLEHSGPQPTSQMSGRQENVTALTF